MKSMFEYEEKNGMYWIFGDKIKGKYGPFTGVFVKNKYLGEIDAEKIDEKEYPGYKYSIGTLKNKLFIIGLEGIDGILDIND